MMINPLHHCLLISMTKRQRQTNCILVVVVVSRKVEVHVISILQAIGIFWQALMAVLIVVARTMMIQQLVSVGAIQSTLVDKSDDLPCHRQYGCICSQVDIHKSHCWDSVDMVVCFVVHEWIPQALDRWIAGQPSFGISIGHLTFEPVIVEFAIGLMGCTFNVLLSIRWIVRKGTLAKVAVVLYEWC